MQEKEELVVWTSKEAELKLCVCKIQNENEKWLELTCR